MYVDRSHKTFEVGVYGYMVGLINKEDPLLPGSLWYYCSRAAPAMLAITFQNFLAINSLATPHNILY